MASAEQRIFQNTVLDKISSMVGVETKEEAERNFLNDMYRASGRDGIMEADVERLRRYHGAPPSDYFE